MKKNAFILIASVLICITTISCSRVECANLPLEVFYSDSNNYENLIVQSYVKGSHFTSMADSAAHYTKAKITADKDWIIEVPSKSIVRKIENIYYVEHRAYYQGVDDVGIYCSNYIHYTLDGKEHSGGGWQHDNDLEYTASINIKNE